MFPTYNLIFKEGENTKRGKPIMMTRDCVWSGNRTETKGEQPLQMYHRREKGGNL